jgi:hypothetical protein
VLLFYNACACQGMYVSHWRQRSQDLREASQTPKRPPNVVSTTTIHIRHRQHFESRIDTRPWRIDASCVLIPQDISMSTLTKPFRWFYREFGLVSIYATGRNA